MEGPDIRSPLVDAILMSFRIVLILRYSLLVEQAVEQYDAPFFTTPLSKILSSKFNTYMSPGLLWLLLQSAWSRRCSLLL